MPKIEPFEFYADKYEDWFEKHKLVYDAELRAIRKLLSDKGIGLEIGAGTARFAVPLGIKVGIEPSSRMGEIARNRGIEVVKGVAEALPLCNSCFDCALMVTTICFLDDIKAAFSEAYRILKPDGRLVIGFIDKDSPVGKLYQQHKEDSVFYKSANFYSVDDLISMLQGAGFNEFQFSQTIFHNLAEIREIEQIKDGFGEGSFVVLKAVK